MKRLLVLASAVVCASTLHSLEQADLEKLRELLSQSIDTKILHAFHESSSLEEYLKAQQLIVTGDAESTEKPDTAFLEHALQLAQLYNMQQEQNLEYTQKTGIPKQYLLGIAAVATVSLYFLSRLPVACFTKSTSGIRWPILPISRFTTWLGYTEQSYLRKAILGCEVACGLFMGAGLAYATADAAYFVSTVEKRMKEKITLMNSIIEYLKIEVETAQE